MAITPTNEDEMTKTETLYFRQNLSADTIHKMKEYRKATIALSAMLESFGNSRELSVAFTNLESAQMYVNKHLCLVDPQSTREELE